jgi:putative peptidoglycan lipid II flippase
MLEFGYVGIILSSIISSYLNLILLISILIRKNHFSFEAKFMKKLTLIMIPSILMAVALIALREYFYINDYFNKIIELIIMISSGLIIYFISSYFLGSLNILIKSNIFKRKKNDIAPAA